MEPATRRVLAAVALAEAIIDREDVSVPMDVARGPLRAYRALREDGDG